MNQGQTNGSHHWMGDRVPLVALACFIVAGGLTLRYVSAGRQPILILALLQASCVVALLVAAFQRPFRLGWRKLIVSCAVAAALAILIPNLITFLTNRAQN
jgi:hypothetical protein